MLCDNSQSLVQLFEGNFSAHSHSCEALPSLLILLRLKRELIPCGREWIAFCGCQSLNRKSIYDGNVNHLLTNKAASTHRSVTLPANHPEEEVSVGPTVFQADAERIYEMF
jgi:hypothetical protein